MSIRAMVWVWDLREWQGRPLDALEKFVLIAMADYADEEGRNIRPAVTTLAGKTSLSVRKVQYILATLKSRGLIESEAVTAHGVNVYRLKFGGGAQYAPGGAQYAPGGAQYAPGGAQYAPGGVHSMHQGGARLAPDPSLNHQNDPSGRENPPPPVNQKFPKDKFLEVLGGGKGNIK